MSDQPIYYVVMQEPQTYTQPQPRKGGSPLLRLVIIAGIGYAIYRLHEETERRRKEEADLAVKMYHAHKNDI